MVYPFPDLSIGGTVINKPQSLHESSNLSQIHIQQTTELVTICGTGGGPRDTKQRKRVLGPEDGGPWKATEDHGRPHRRHLEWAVIEQRFEIWRTRLTGFHERN